MSVFVRHRCLVAIIDDGSPEGHGWQMSNDGLAIILMTIPPAPDSILKFIVIVTRVVVPNGVDVLKQGYIALSCANVAAIMTHILTHPVTIKICLPVKESPLDFVTRN